MIPASFECESIERRVNRIFFDSGKATTRAKRRITPALRGYPETSQNEPHWALVFRGEGIFAPFEIRRTRENRGEQIRGSWYPRSLCRWREQIDT
jgi:hypothetical protein